MTGWYIHRDKVQPLEKDISWTKHSILQRINHIRCFLMTSNVSMEVVIGKTFEF